MSTGATEVRFAGFGGQGVVLAGVLLGTAAVMFDGLQAVQTQTYGSAARGGGARSEVIISGGEIIYPQVTRPDIMVAMSAEAIDKYVKDMKPGGLLVIDEDLVPDPKRDDCEVHRVPASRIAVNELGRDQVANLVMVGFVVGKTKIVSVEAAKSAVRSTVPRGTEELNLKAFGRGYELAVSDNSTRRRYRHSCHLRSPSERAFRFCFCHSDPRLEGHRPRPIRWGWINGHLAY